MFNSWLWNKFQKFIKYSKHSKNWETLQKLSEIISNSLNCDQVSWPKFRRNWSQSTHFSQYFLKSIHRKTSYKLKINKLPKLQLQNKPNPSKTKLNHVRQPRHEEPRSNHQQTPRKFQKSQCSHGHWFATNCCCWNSIVWKIVCSREVYWQVSSVLCLKFNFLMKLIEFWGRKEVCGEL